jgi:hypothetical protein
LDLNVRVEGLAREVSDIEGRVAALEAREGRAAGAPARAHVSSKAMGAAAAVPREDVAAALPVDSIGLVGRTLLILGGAYLLRAVTEAEMLPPPLGALAGLAYAAIWLHRCAVAAARGARPIAFVHGVASVTIAYPLVVEVATRLQAIAPTSAGAAVFAIYAATMAVASRRSLALIAWANALFAGATLLVLSRATRDLLPFASAALAAAFVSESLAQRGRFLPLRWPAAVTLNAMVLWVVSLAQRPGGVPDGYRALPAGAVTLLGLVLPLLYVASVARRTLRQSQAITPFEIAQTVASLVIGLGGVAQLRASHGHGPGLVASLAIALGAACYTTAFFIVDRGAGPARNFHAFSSTAGVLTLAGAAMVLDAASLALACAALALVAAWVGGRFDRMTLRFHAVGYLVTAGEASGLRRSAQDGLLALADASWAPISPAGGFVLASSALAWRLLKRYGRKPASLRDHAARLLVLAIAAAGAAGVVSRTAAGLLAGAPGSGADAALTATCRTAALSGLALALARLGRSGGTREAAWLVYPLLIVVGLKLIVEDWSVGRPLTQFLALAMYGGVLMVVPGMLGGHSPAAKPTDGSANGS